MQGSWPHPSLAPILPSNPSFSASFSPMCHSTSRRICRTRLVCWCRTHGAGYLDTRLTLRAAAETRILHGPIDWIHFNEAGYRILGGLALERLQGRRGTNACGTLASSDVWTLRRSGCSGRRESNPSVQLRKRNVSQVSHLNILCAI